MFRQQDRGVSLGVHHENTTREEKRRVDGYIDRLVGVRSECRKEICCLEASLTWGSTTYSSLSPLSKARETKD